MFCLVDRFWIGERLTYGLSFAFLGTALAVSNLALLMRNRPALVIDHAGLTMHPGGFLAWQQISGVRIAHQQFQEMLEIWLDPHPSSASGPHPRAQRRGTRGRFPRTITHLALHPYTPDDVIHALREYNPNLTVFAFPRVYVVDRTVHLRAVSGRNLW